MKIFAKVHGKDTMKQIRKDYPNKSDKQAVKALLGDALMSLFKKGL
jgi:hypothetical protein